MTNEDICECGHDHLRDAWAHTVEFRQEICPYPRCSCQHFTHQQKGGDENAKSTAGLPTNPADPKPQADAKAGDLKEFSLKVAEEIRQALFAASGYREQTKFFKMDEVANVILCNLRLREETLLKPPISASQTPPQPS